MAEVGTHLKSPVTYKSSGRRCRTKFANNRFDYYHNYTQHVPCKMKAEFNGFENITFGSSGYDRKEFGKPVFYRNDCGVNEDDSPLSLLAHVRRYKKNDLFRTTALKFPSLEGL